MPYTLLQYTLSCGVAVAGKEGGGAGSGPCGKGARGVRQPQVPAQQRACWIRRVAGWHQRCRCAPRTHLLRHVGAVARRHHAAAAHDVRSNHAKLPRVALRCQLRRGQHSAGSAGGGRAGQARQGPSGPPLCGAAAAASASAACGSRLSPMSGACPSWCARLAYSAYRRSYCGSAACGAVAVHSGGTGGDADAVGVLAAVESVPHPHTQGWVPPLHDQTW
jgi:hypothetical protein